MHTALQLCTWPGLEGCAIQPWLYWGAAGFTGFYTADMQSWRKKKHLWEEQQNLLFPLVTSGSKSGKSGGESGTITSLAGGGREQITVCPIINYDEQGLNGSGKSLQKNGTPPTQPSRL